MKQGWKNRQWLAAALMWGCLLAGSILGRIPADARAVIRETEAEDHEIMYEIEKTVQSGTAVRTSSQAGPDNVVCGNPRAVVIETGVNLDWAPYVHMLACSGAGILLLRRRPQKKEGSTE